MSTEKNDIQILDDGAVLVDGKLAEDAGDEEQAEAEAENSEPLKLSDVLPWSGGVTHPAIHPENIQAILDLPRTLEMLETLSLISRETPIIFPVHPRTRKGLNQVLNEIQANKNVKLVDPLPYLEFLALQQAAALVITDSGGIQEETTFLGVPCLTVRENTERPITVEIGTNVLVGRDLDRLKYEAEQILGGHKPGGHEKEGRIPPLWDGHAAERIAEVLMRQYQGSAEVAVAETPGSVDLALRSSNAEKER